MTWGDMFRESEDSRRRARVQNEEFRKALMRMARARHQYISLPDEGGEQDHGPTPAEVDDACRRVASESGLTLD